MTNDRDELLEELAAYGYPLMKPSRLSEPEVVLEKLLRQHEGRLLEGYAVVLLNALRRKAGLQWELQKWDPKKDLGAERSLCLAQLLALSYLLFRLFAVEKSLQDRTLKLLEKCADGEGMLKDLEAAFTKSEPITVNGVALSTDRLKRTFLAYHVGTHDKRKEEEKTRTLEVELLLSSLFTPRQKELLRKRAEHAPMTPSEKTYFYRTVNKRLKALADEDVHALALKLVGK